MQTPVKSLFGLFTLFLALSLSSVATRAADDASKPVTLTQVGLVAVKSIDSATAFVKQTGLDLPPNFSAAGLEQQFPFIGKDGIDTTRPIGIIVCGGPDLGFEQMLGFVFPVKPTGGTLESLKGLGGTIMPDHADTVLMGGVGIRRTADYLIFSPNPNVATSINTSALVAAVKGDDALAKMTVDFKTLRTAMPEQYKAMLGVFQAGALKDAKTDADKENSMMFVGPIMKTIDTIDRLDVGLESGEKGVRLALTASPLKIATAAQANRPGMPAGVFARIDTNFASTESTASIRAQLQKAFNTGALSDSTLTDEQRKKLEGIANRLGVMVFDAATTSLGIEVAEGAPVLYVVQHWSKQIDAPKEWKALVDDVNAIAGGKGEDVAVETYTEDTMPITRITVKSGQKVRMDIGQKDNDVFITISPAEAHHIAALAAANAAGPMKGVLSGWIDLGKSADTAIKFPDSPLAGLPPDMQKQLGDLLKGQRISINTSADGDAGTLDITVTKGLLENIPKLIDLFSPHDAKPDAK